MLLSGFLLKKGCRRGRDYQAIYQQLISLDSVYPHAWLAIPCLFPCWEYHISLMIIEMLFYICDWYLLLDLLLTIYWFNDIIPVKMQTNNRYVKSFPRWGLLCKNVEITFIHDKMRVRFKRGQYIGVSIANGGLRLTF